MFEADKGAGLSHPNIVQTFKSSSLISKVSSSVQLGRCSWLPPCCSHGIPLIWLCSHIQSLAQNTPEVDYAQFADALRCRQAFPSNRHWW